MHTGHGACGGEEPEVCTAECGCRRTVHSAIPPRAGGRSSSVKTRLFCSMSPSRRSCRYRSQICTPPPGQGCQPAAAAPGINRDAGTESATGPPSPCLPTQNLQASSANRLTDSFRYSLPSSPPGECIKLIVFKSKTEKSKTSKDFFSTKDRNITLGFSRDAECCCRPVAELLRSGVGRRDALGG